MTWGRGSCHMWLNQPGLRKVFWTIGRQDLPQVRSRFSEAAKPPRPVGQPQVAGKVFCPDYE